MPAMALSHNEGQLIMFTLEGLLDILMEVTQAMFSSRTASAMAQLLTTEQQIIICILEEF